MARPYSDKIIPHHRRGCEVLLESVNYNLSLLTAAQITACREIYHLDDDLTIEQIIRHAGKGLIVSPDNRCACGGTCVSDNSVCSLIGTEECHCKKVDGGQL